MASFGAQQAILRKSHIFCVIKLVCGCRSDFKKLSDLVYTGPDRELLSVVCPICCIWSDENTARAGDQHQKNMKCTQGSVQRPRHQQHRQGTGLWVRPHCHIAQKAAYGSQGQGPLGPTVQRDTAQQAGRQPHPHSVLVRAQESLRTSRAHYFCSIVGKKKVLMTACHKTEQAAPHLPSSLTTTTGSHS